MPLRTGKALVFLKKGKSFLNLENEKRGYNKVMLLNEENPNFVPFPLKEASKNNPKIMPITEGEGINNEFCKPFQKICSKQDVEDNSTAIQEFLSLRYFPSSICKPM